MSGSMVRDTLSDLTLDLVRIPSPSGREDQAADYVEAFLHDRAHPDYLRRHGRAVVAGCGWDPASGDPSDVVVLAGHLDTVPENGHPAPRRSGGEVVGLGSSDMKGALAVMLALAERHAAGARPLGLVFYDCEEISYEQNGMRAVFESEPWLKRAGASLLMEPTGNVLELGCQGTLHARVTFRGAAAHSARPWLGRNAIHMAGKFLQELDAIQPRDVVQGPAVFREVVSATMAEGGVSRNIIPDAFTLNLNLRFPPDRTCAEAEAHLRSLVPEGVAVEITDLAPAAPARLDSPVLRELADRHGLESRAKQAWTDVAQFALHGVPAANFGPGVPELAHRVDERVPEENLVRSFEVLAEFFGISGGA